MRNKKLIILFSVMLSLTLLVVINGALFSVRHVNAYCANTEKSRYEGDVLSSAGIKRGTSIFSVDKGKVTKSVQKNVAGVRVLNIEKKFPNRIYINFVEVYEYVKVYSGGKTYFCGNDMRVMRSEDGLGESSKAIALKYRGELTGTTEGSVLDFGNGEGICVPSVITEIFSALEQLGYYDTVIDLFYEIDLTGNFIVLTTRNGDAPGMKWKIITPDNLVKKLRLALSVYSSKLTDIQKRDGTLILQGDKCLLEGEGGVA